MPSGPRIRANNVFGVISDNPLTIGATSFNSVSLFLLPAVSSAHAIIVLDPKRVNGEPEIVIVTAHTVLATVATITRGAYGTAARAHPLNTAWANVVVTDDMVPVVTTGTRPSDPYFGQLIYNETLNSFEGRDTIPSWKNVNMLADPPAVRVYDSDNAQTLNNATTVALAYDTELYDTDNMWAIGSPSRFTINTAGVYHLFGCVSLTGETDYTSILYFFRTGGVTSIGQARRLGNGDGSVDQPQFNISIHHKFAAAEFVEFCVSQENTSGNAEATVVGLSTVTFGATWVGRG